MRSCYQCRIMDDFATTKCRFMIPVPFIFVARQSLLFRNSENYSFLSHLVMKLPTEEQKYIQNVLITITVISADRSSVNRWGDTAHS